MKLKLVIPAALAVVSLCYSAAETAPHQQTMAGVQAPKSTEASSDTTTSFAIVPIAIEPEVLSLIATKWNNHFNPVAYPKQVLNHVTSVEPGSSIQAAIDATSSAGGGVVLLKSGTHVLAEQLMLRSKITLCGEGRTRTVLKQGPSFLHGTAIGAGSGQLTDVVIKDLTLDGLQTGGTAGIVLAGADPASHWHARIMLQNVNVTHWAGMGVHIKRTSSIIMDQCEFQYNGSANALFHNIYFLHVERVLQSDCDMSFPVLGKGNKYTSTRDLIAQRCTIRECKGNGIQADNINCGHLLFHKYTISNCGRVAMWFPCENFTDKYKFTEDPKFAPQFVIINRCNIVDNQWGAMWRNVSHASVINSTFRNARLDLGLFKCDVVFENSTLEKPAENYTDIGQWPHDVPVLW